MKTRLAFACLLLAAGIVHAQDDDVPGCAEAMQHPLPPEANVESKAAPDCDSAALLAERDYAAARRCAWAERAGGDELVFNGPGVLMTLYANGWGVARDFGLARRMACETGGAPAETEGRLEHLAALAAGTDTEPFDFCDDITSGYMQGYCADRDAQAAREKRDAAWQALLAGWPAGHVAAWKPLRAAADAFFEARVANEVDASGTGRLAFIVYETEALAQGLLEHVQAFERGELPRAGDLAAADARLNASYAAARAAAMFEDAEEMFGPLGTIRPEGIRDTERAWIRYRDAWVEFGRRRYPQVQADAWRLFFTLERERQLRELAEGV